MKIQETYRKSVLSMIFHGSMISCGLVMVSLAFEPAVVSAANASAVEIKAIKRRLVNVTTKDELMSTLQEAKSAGAPWQILFESTILYTLKTGDYSLLNVITPHIKEYTSDFNLNESLLFDSETEAAVFLRVFAACIDLHNGNEESALDNLREAKSLDPIEYKELLRYAITIQKYINA